MRRRLERVLGRSFDCDATVKSHSQLVERLPAEGGQRVVEAIQRPLEHVDEGHGVTGLSERRCALGSDQAGSDDDHLHRATRQQGPRVASTRGSALTNALSRPGTGGGR